MPSSWNHVIPIVANQFVLRRPKRVLDIGIGRGKYGLLAREYGNAETVHGIEADESYLTRIQDNIYNKIWVNDVRKVLHELDPKGYDLVLMADVIEHMSHEEGHKIIKHFTCPILVTTPDMDYPQHDHEHPFENHVSRWREEDFARYYPYERLHDPLNMGLIVVVRP